MARKTEAPDSPEAGGAGLWGGPERGAADQAGRKSEPPRQPRRYRFDHAGFPPEPVRPRPVAADHEEQYPDRLGRRGRRAAGRPRPTARGEEADPHFDRHGLVADVR